MTREEDNIINSNSLLLIFSKKKKNKLFCKLSYLFLNSLLMEFKKVRIEGEREREREASVDSFLITCWLIS